MNYNETVFYVKAIAPSIGQLARQKDKLALAVINAWARLHKCPLDVRLQNELVRVVNEYAVRSMTLTELDELERRFGVDHPNKQAFRDGPLH